MVRRFDCGSRMAGSRRFSMRREIVIDEVLRAGEWAGWRGRGGVEMDLEAYTFVTVVAVPLINGCRELFI